MSPNGEQYDSLLRQLRDRMDEGCGETIYVVGMGSGENHSQYIVGLGKYHNIFDRIPFISIFCICEHYLVLSEHCETLDNHH